MDTDITRGCLHAQACTQHSYILILIESFLSILVYFVDRLSSKTNIALLCCLFLYKQPGPGLPLIPGPHIYPLIEPILRSRICALDIPYLLRKEPLPGSLLCGAWILDPREMYTFGI